MKVLEEVLAGRWFQPDSPLTHKFTLSNEKLVVVTGGNASGKSLFRKILAAHYKDRNLIHVSQEGRTKSGIQRAFMYGSEEDDSTGYNSVKTLLKAIQSAQDGRHLLIDEPDIGASDEVQAGMGLKIFESLENLKFVIVITHSRELVAELLPARPSHLRLGDQMELIDWIDRKIVPADLEKLVSDGKEMWRKVAKLINERGQSNG